VLGAIQGLNSPREVTITFLSIATMWPHENLIGSELQCAI
jgi:hypothetical protein